MLTGRGQASISTPFEDHLPLDEIVYRLRSVLIMCILPEKMPSRTLMSIPSGVSFHMREHVQH